MLRAERTVTIAAGAGDVWALVADLETYPDWHPFFTTVDVTGRDGAGRVAAADCTHHTPVGTLKTRMELAYEGETQIEARRASGDFKSMTGTFVLEPAGGEGTAVTHRLHVDPGMKLGLVLRGPVEERVRESVLNGVFAGLARRLGA